jgi:hypothetical protein
MASVHGCRPCCCRTIASQPYAYAYMWSMRMVHKIFLDISRGTMIKTWTSPIQTSCRALMMRSTIFLFLYSPGPSHVLLLHAHWRERGNWIEGFRYRCVYVCARARALYRHADQVWAGRERPAPQVKVKHWNLMESRDRATFHNISECQSEGSQTVLHVKWIPLNSRVLLVAIMSVQTKETYHEKKGVCVCLFSQDGLIDWSSTKKIANRNPALFVYADPCVLVLHTLMHYVQLLKNKWYGEK